MHGHNTLVCMAHSMCYTRDLSVKSRTRPHAERRLNNGVSSVVIKIYSTSDLKFYLFLYQQPPTPPVPVSLHLGITAQTHSIPDYCHLFPDFDSFYINYQSMLARPAPVVEHSCKMTEGEREMTTLVLGQILKYVSLVLCTLNYISHTLHLHFNTLCTISISLLLCSES